MNAYFRVGRLSRMAPGAAPATMALVAVLWAVAAVQTPALAQDTWNSFAENDGIRPPSRLGLEALFALWPRASQT